jgi:hypothetical protein
MGFYILPTADDKEALTCQNKKMRTNKKEEIICQEVEHTSSWTRGLTS